MIKGYFKHIRCDADREYLLVKIQELPLHIQEHIFKYQNLQDRALAVAGKLLLRQLLIDEALGGADLLDELQHRPSGKPCFDTGLDFNISHSGDVAICVVSKIGTIGVDIEQVTDRDINVYRDNFTVAEWTTINYSKDKLQAFYRIWVRKEALVKATGDGLQLTLNAVDVCNDKVAVEGEVYYLNDIYVGEGYKGCVCSSETEDVDVREESLQTGGACCDDIVALV